MPSPLHSSKRTSRACFDLPALCQNATFALRQKRWLFDHLVGKREQLIRHRQAERPGCFEVDCQLEFGWLLHRQLGGILPFENTANVHPSLTKRVGNVCAVAHESTVRDE